MPGYITDFILNGIQNVHYDCGKLRYSPLINWNVPLININPNVKWITNNLNNLKIPLFNLETLHLKELVDYHYNIVTIPKNPLGKITFYDIVYLDDRLVYIMKIDKLFSIQ